MEAPNQGQSSSEKRIEELLQHIKHLRNIIGRQEAVNERQQYVIEKQRYEIHILRQSAQKCQCRLEGFDMVANKQDSPMLHEAAKMEEDMKFNETISDRCRQERIGEETMFIYWGDVLAHLA